MIGFKRPESVLIVVHTTAGEVLSLRRIHPPDFWQSVTGSLEEGETPDVAAHRELLEETGIDAWPVATGQTNVYPIHPEWRHRFAPDVTENLEHVFSVQLDEKPVIHLDPQEHAEFAWLPKSAAAKLAGSATDAGAIIRIA